MRFANVLRIVLVLLLVAGMGVATVFRDQVDTGTLATWLQRAKATAPMVFMSVLRSGDVLLRGTCMDARGLTEEELAEEARRSSIDELAEMIAEADKVLVF